MNRFRLRAICAAIGVASALASSWAADLGNLIDASGTPVGTGHGTCVQTSGDGGDKCPAPTTAPASAAAGTSSKAMADSGTAASGAAPAAMASAGAGGAAAAAEGTATPGHVQYSTGAPVRNASGECIAYAAGAGPEHPADCVVGGATAAAAPAAAPAASGGSAASSGAGAAAAPAASTMAAGPASTGGEVTYAPGHLMTGAGVPVMTSSGECINLGYSLGPDHPADCIIKPKQMAAAPKATAPSAAVPAEPTPPPAPPAAASPGTVATAPAAGAAAPARAVPPAAVPGTVTSVAPTGGDTGAGGAADTLNPLPDYGPERDRVRAAGEPFTPPTEVGGGAAPSMAKPGPVAPPTSVPGTVSNVQPIGGAGEPSMAKADSISPPPDFGPEQTRPRASGEPFTPPSEVGGGAAPTTAGGDAAPAPVQPVPAPPTVIAREPDMRGAPIPPPQRPEPEVAAAPAPAAPRAPASSVPGTVAQTAPAGGDAAPAPKASVEVKPAEGVKPKAPEREVIELGADVLFKFDRYRERDMLSGGREKLDDVANKITSYDNATIDSIKVIGHTDRLASDAYNQKLSERRAATVKKYLVKKGVDGSKMTSEGHGEREPKVFCKGNKATRKLIACLQPNRRVEVEIKGFRQK